MNNYSEQKKKWDLKNVIWSTQSLKFGIITAMLGVIYGGYWVAKNIEKNKEASAIENKKMTLNKRIEQSKEIQDMICDIGKIVGANLTKLTVAGNYIIGIHLDNDQLTKTKIYITNECLVKSPISLKEIYPESELRYYADFLKGIEDNNGTFIIDSTRPLLKEGQIRSILVRTGIQSFLEEGVYRLPTNHHDQKYLVGVVSVAFFYKNHNFTSEQERLIKLKVAEIAREIDRIHREHINK